MKPKIKHQLSWGLRKSRRGKAWSIDGKVLAKKVMRGILVGLIILMVQPITAKANCHSYREPHYEDGIPTQIRTYCELVGTEYNICPELLESIIYRESRFEPEAKNGIHYGLMQINYKIHADRIAEYGWSAEDLFDPYKNIMIGADILSELYEKYGDENPIVLSIYSGNWNAVSKYKEYGFMCEYVTDVLERSADYERKHGK